MKHFLIITIKVLQLLVLIALWTDNHQYKQHFLGSVSAIAASPARRQISTVSGQLALA